MVQRGLKFFVSVLFAVTLFGAADGAQAERRLALVIGNGAYTIGPLGNPVNDAELMAQTLRDAGFEVTHETDLGYRPLQRAVVGFGRDLAAAGEDTVGMVYYAGHAVQANGENYLIPVDAEIQDELDLEIQTLEVSTLMRSLEKAGNRLNMVVLDACRNNPFKTMSRSGTRGLAKVDAPYGTLLAYSTAPGDVAADGTGRNSPYTRALAKAIRTPGVPVEQLFKQVRIEVMERTGNRQVPWETSSLTGDFYFLDAAPAPAAAAPAPEAGPQEADIEYWKSIAASNDPALFRSYLEAFPDGTFANLARQRIDSLEASRAAQAEAQAVQQREAQAAAAWNAVKDSDDPAMLQTVADRYPDTLYAQLAQVRIETLSASRTQQLAAADATATSQDDGAAERLFWDSIKNSSSKSDYEAYLSRYPDGLFADIARNRAENGYQPRVAALGVAPSSAHLYDGKWLVTWKVVSGFYGGVPWCKAGESGTTEIVIEDGAFEGRMVSNSYGSARVTITVSEAGGMRFLGKVSGWSEGTISNQFTVGADGFEETTLKGTGYCQATLEMKRP